MRTGSALSKHGIARYLLIAIMLRAFVATGWMLQLPAGDDIAAPTLVICPQQTPALAAWLTDEHSGHTHHHSDDADTDDDQSISVSDTGCVLWTGSAVANAATIPTATIVESVAQRPRFSRGNALPAVRPSPRHPRAPPSVS